MLQLKVPPLAGHLTSDSVRIRIRLSVNNTNLYSFATQ